MADNEEVALNVDIPTEVYELVEDTMLRLRLAGDRKLKKKALVAEVLRRYVPVYERERAKQLAKAKT